MRPDFLLNARILVVSFLIMAVGLSIFSVPSGSSQSSSITTTMTLTQPAPGQCTVRSLAFLGVQGKGITGTYGADAQISFYILTLGQLNSIQNCRLPEAARPLFVEMNAVGHGNPYRSLLFPANGTYYFVFIFVSGPAILASGYATVELSFPSSIIMINNSTSSSSPNTTATTIVLPASGTSQATVEPAIGSVGTLGAIVVVAIVAIIGSVMLLARRRRASMTEVPATVEKSIKETAPSEQTIQPPAGERLSTGYSDLDRLLMGGFPRHYAILLLSPPCDEKDLLLRKIIGSAVFAKIPTYYLSNDSMIQDVIGRYPQDFYALSPQADKIVSPPANLYKIPAIDSLSDLNIEFTKIVEMHPNEGTVDRFLIIDLLTDILLSHKGVTTRKWLSEFIARRKAEGFTVLAYLNPLVSPDVETQTLIDVFEGVIEIYEKGFGEKSRRFIVVKRMYGLRYSDAELMLDKDKLF